MRESGNSHTAFWARQRTDFRALALLAAILPLLTINVCYLIAIALEHRPVCIPYLSGCTSVSSTGRLLPESLVFKAGMLPSTVILALFWHRCANFLESCGRPRLQANALRTLGVIAALALTMYAVALGVRDDEARLIRRIGMVGFALGFFLCELVFVVNYKKLRTAATAGLWPWLLVFCAALPALGLGSEIAKWAGAPRDPANHIAAWNSFAVLAAWFAVMAVLAGRHRGLDQSASSPSGRAASPRL